MILWKNPQTGEKMEIILIHFLAELKNEEALKPADFIREYKWVEINDIKKNKIAVAPNVKFLIEKGDIK